MALPGLKLDLAGMGRKNVPDGGTLYDLVIVGGGPAAMSAAIYAARKMLELALVARDFGGQVASTSEIENYLGFQTVTGEELVRRFVQQMEHFGVPAAKGETVERIVAEDGRFGLEVAGGKRYQARSVILATGKRDRPLGVPGEQALVGRGVAYCSTCDAPFYRGKKVVVVGGGNSAFTAALDLLKVDAELTLVNFAAGWQADEVMQEAVRARAERVRFLDRHAVVQLHGRKRVEGVTVENRDTSEQFRLDCDGVFVEIGLVPNSEPVRGLVDLNPAGEVIIDCFCRTSVAGIFGAGDVTTVAHKQIVISAGEGAKAALSAYDHLTRNRLI